MLMHLLQFVIGKLSDEQSIFGLPWQHLAGNAAFVG